MGFTMAALIGITLGLVCARVQLVARLTLPLVETIRPISPIAWIPIAVLWFGLGDRPAAFLIYIGAFFPIFTNAFLGFSAVELRYVRAAQVLGFGRLQFFRDVLLMSALPYLFAGLRIGFGVGWMCVDESEMMGARNGLGYMIQMNRVVFEIPNILVGMITIGLIGFVVNELMRVLEARLLPWVGRA
jgi:NitT/TauT family transport system permease protein/sulfonate transport system permease protein